MDEVSLWETASTVLAGVATLAMFSFLLKENPFYRFVEHIIIGIAAGLGPVLIIRDFLWPQVFEGMLGLSVVTYPDGTVEAPYNPLYLLYLIPMAFGSLYYFIYSKRYNWLAKLVIGFTLGASGALAIKGFFAEVIPQIESSFKPLVVVTGGVFDIAASVNNAIFVATLVLVLNYFFFTFGREGSMQGKIAPLGRPLLMVCFGAFFGSTVMARLALLVERVQFLLQDWVASIRTLVGLG